MPRDQHLSPDRGGETVTVVPGQELVVPDGWNAYVDHRDKELDQGSQGLFAVRPGTSEVVLTQPRHEVEDITVKVRVVAPRTDQGTEPPPNRAAASDISTLLSPGANAAGPAALPHCA